MIKNYSGDLIPPFHFLLLFFVSPRSIYYKNYEKVVKGWQPQTTRTDAMPLQKQNADLVSTCTDITVSGVVLFVVCLFICFCLFLFFPPRTAPMEGLFLTVLCDLLRELGARSKNSLIILSFFEKCFMNWRRTLLDNVCHSFMTN